MNSGKSYSKKQMNPSTIDIKIKKFKHKGAIVKQRKIQSLPHNIKKSNKKLFMSKMKNRIENQKQTVNNQNFFAKNQKFGKLQTSQKEKLPQKEFAPNSPCLGEHKTSEFAIADQNEENELFDLLNNLSIGQVQDLESSFSEDQTIENEWGNVDCSQFYESDEEFIEQDMMTGRNPLKPQLREFQLDRYPIESC